MASLPDDRQTLLGYTDGTLRLWEDPEEQEGPRLHSTVTLDPRNPISAIAVLSVLEAALVSFSNVLALLKLEKLDSLEEIARITPDHGGPQGDITAIATEPGAYHSWVSAADGTLMRWGNELGFGGGSSEQDRDHLAVHRSSSAATAAS